MHGEFGKTASPGTTSSKQEQQKFKYENNKAEKKSMFTPGEKILGLTLVHSFVLVLSYYF